MVKDVKSLIKKLSPLMDENSAVFCELSVFFGENAKIETEQNDLPKFLGRKRLYRIIKTDGCDYKDCIYKLIDNHPEVLESLGMLRYYISPTKKIEWEKVEQAEIIIGNELTMNPYGWSPDAWTLFEDSSSSIVSEKLYKLTTIIAFDFGE